MVNDYLNYITVRDIKKTNFILGIFSICSTTLIKETVIWILENSDTSKTYLYNTFFVEQG